MFDVARRGDHDVAARVHLAVIGREHAACDRGDHIGRPDHGPSQRVTPEDRFREEIVHELARCVLVHGDLLEHDLALGVEIGERRREHHVGHHVQRLLNVVVRYACVHHRVLPRRGGVELAAEGVENLGDLLRVVVLRALEEQVLDEVRDARLCVRLVARARADPEPDRDRTDARHPLGDHALAGVELRDDVFLHDRIIVPRGRAGAREARARRALSASRPPRMWRPAPGSTSIGAIVASRSSGKLSRPPLRVFAKRWSPHRRTRSSSPALHSTQNGVPSGSRSTVHVRSPCVFVSAIEAPAATSRSTSRRRSSAATSR